MTAALPMGGNKITGMADPSTATDAATKNYIDTIVASFFSTGDVKLTIKTVADAGWVLFNDGTIGSASSGASTRANADTQALFNLLFNSVSDANAPIYTSGGAATTRAAQTNAATAWAANCRIQLLIVLGRALGIAGQGYQLTSRALGDFVGSETRTLATSNLPPYTPSGNFPGGTYNTSSLPTAQGSSFSGGTPDLTTANGSTLSSVSLTVTIPQTALNMNAQGGTSAPFSVVQPIVFMNAMVKL